MTDNKEEPGEWIDVLLVEDSPGDARLTREAFRRINSSIRLHLAADGMEAMEFLRREGAHVRAPRPKLILLDLNLPRMNGHEVLTRVKLDETLRMIPTVVLTTSEREADVLISYQLQANCYLRKPTHWDEFDSVMAGINEFWLAKLKMRQPEPA